MRLLFPLKENKSWMGYLLIVVIFALLVLGVFLFFKTKMRATDSIDPGYQATSQSFQAPAIHLLKTWSPIPGRSNTLYNLDKTPKPLYQNKDEHYHYH